MIAPAFGRLSTGIKMLIILSGALLPLGLIALFASIESAQTNQLNRESEARLMASESARVLSAAIGNAALGLRGALGSFGGVTPDQGACRRTLDTLAMAQRVDATFALFDTQGRRLCATQNFSANRLRAPAPEIGTEVKLLPAENSLRFSVANGPLIGVGDLPRDAIADATRPQIASGSYHILLHQGDALVDLGSSGPPRALSRPLSVITPVAGGQLALEMEVSTTPIGALDVLLILLPLLMWVAAAIIGWLVVDRLLLRPLAQMQRAISTYNVGAGPLVLPTLTTPAQELRGLGEAFRGVTAKLAVHEADLERSLAHQTRLTREVHHRVKNNLQVVSSLINIHARGARGKEAAGAYASIQRRVDALAVVHRNHYAELEENRGVGLRSLIGELASNLRATAPAEAAHMAITLELMPAFASQDVAVPVSFLITELVERAMAGDPRGTIAVRLRPTERPDRAELSIIAPGLKQSEGDTSERFGRVIEGLSRQLRTPLVRDEAKGSFTIEIAIVPQD
jgi:two-component system, sensor histidine kinase PdtaS